MDPRLGDPQPTVVQASSTKTFGIPLPAGQGFGTVFVVAAVVVLALVAIVVVRRRTPTPPGGLSRQRGPGQTWGSPDST